MGVTLIAGYGEGLGASLAKAFAARGDQVAVLARRPSNAQPFLGLRCDLGDPAQVEQAFERLEAELGPADVVVFNAARLVRGAVHQLDPAEFERCWRTGVMGAFLCSQRALEPMMEAGRGTLLFSGATASLRGGANFAAFASAKFALRGLAQSLARAYGPLGIHVAHVVIDGIIGNRQGSLDPDSIGSAYVQLADQVPSAWSHELDLRPMGETF